MPDPILLDPAGADRRSMVDQAHAALKAQILSGGLRGGENFLEEELAARFHMSRTPVREAVVRLAQEGFVEIVPRRGIRISQMTKRDVREVHEVLECLEVQAAERLALRRLSAEDMARLDGAVRGMDEALVADDIEAWTRADYEFHKLLIELAGNRHLEGVARNFLEKAYRFRMLTLPMRTKPIKSTTSHAALVEAVRRGDHEMAVEIHRVQKRRWARDMDDLLNRLDLPSGD